MPNLFCGRLRQEVINRILKGASKSSRGISIYRLKVRISLLLKPFYLIDSSAS